MLVIPGGVNSALSEENSNCTRRKRLHILNDGDTGRAEQLSLPASYSLPSSTCFSNSFTDRLCGFLVLKFSPLPEGPYR